MINRMCLPKKTQKDGGLIRGWGVSCSWLWSFCPSACVSSEEKRPLPQPQAQLPEQELHYATLLRLPEREGPNLKNQGREGGKEDLSTDYACIAKNEPT
uniref:Uncharacterized protein n=1 Tax=Catagonus wagneri TaxID=51154 RepID=A0A8C3W223_9CETA